MILFECATLHKPFVADSLFDLLRKHVEAPPPSPRALRRDMPEALEHIIYTALAKLPEQRFASAQAMSMALQHANLPSEQWIPIVPTSSARIPSGGWQPTPPASWAGGHRPSVATGPTQTGAGQITPGTSGGSKGLWIALGALLLVSAGITAAVLAGGTQEPPPAPAAAAGSATPPAQSARGDSWATPGSAEMPPTPIAQSGDESDDDDNGDLDEETTALMDDTVGEMFDDLDPTTRAMLPPEIGVALKKYGTWSKIRSGCPSRSTCHSRSPRRRSSRPMPCCSA